MTQCQATSCASTNSANFFNAGLKGRFHEEEIDDDHRLTDIGYSVERWQDGAIVCSEVPALNALNQRLRNDYVADVQKGIDRNEVTCVVATTRSVLRSPECDTIGTYQTTISYFVHDGTLYSDAISVPIRDDVPLGYNSFAA